MPPKNKKQDGWVRINKPELWKKWKKEEDAKNRRKRNSRKKRMKKGR